MKQEQIGRPSNDGGSRESLPVGFLLNGLKRRISNGMRSKENGSFLLKIDRFNWWRDSSNS